MRTGDSYVESLRDGRNVILDGEHVDDVSTHPAFADAARSVARLYDFAADPANRELMTYESPHRRPCGEPELAGAPLGAGPAPPPAGH